MWKYDWNDIEIFLIDRLKKCKSIQTFGTIGSRNVTHDIDIIVTKKPHYHSVLFYKELHTLFEYLHIFLKKKYRKKLIRFTCFNHEKEVLKLGKYKKGDLALHVMDYVSLPQLESDWRPHIIKGFSIRSLLRDNYDLLLGMLIHYFPKNFLNPENMMQ